MAYRPKHFKVHASIQNHRKTIGVFDDDSLLAMYVRIGISAIERFADRTDDSFLVSPRDLEGLAGCRGVANARRKLGRLEAASRLTVCQEGAGYRVGFPNFKRKQGFTSQADPEVVPKRTPSSTPTTTPTTTPTKTAENTPASRARAVWPELVELASSLGGKWRERPGTKQLDAIKARLAEGAHELDLLDAVRGYIRKNGTEARDGFDPMRHFTATTVFRSGKFDGNVEGASMPVRGSSVVESPAEGRQRRTRENTQKALELLKRREADRLKLVAGGKG
jgi:hypothetical protein